MHHQLFKTWLDTVVSEYAICGNYETTRHGDTCVVAAQDRPTAGIGAFPMPSNNTDDTAYSLRLFVGFQSQPTPIYTDDTGEFVAAIHDIGWFAVHDTATLYRHQANGIAERSVRLDKEGTSSVRGAIWVSRGVVAMQCFGFLWSTTPGAGQMPSYRLCFGTVFHGPRDFVWRDCDLQANAICKHGNYPHLS